MATLKSVFGATPSTTRGKPIHVGGDPKGNNFLYTCGTSVFIRNVEDPSKTELYTEHTHATTVARYAPSGFYIASGDVVGNVRIWDTTQKEHILKIEIKAISGPIVDLQWSEDSKRIVAVGEGKDKFGSVFLFDSGSSVGEISGHSKPITSCDMKQTRPYRVATGSEDFGVAWLEGPPFKFKKLMKEHTRFVNCVRFSPDGNKLLTVGGDKLGFIYDGKEGNLIGQLSATDGHSAAIYSCSWSKDSKQILTASADKSCKIWDAETRNCLKTFKFGDAVEDMMVGCLWQNNDLLAFALSGNIYYLDPENPSKPKRVIYGHNKLITCVAYDGTGHLYTGSYDSSIVQWNTQDGTTNPLIGKGHGNQINRLVVQGNNLVSAAMDDTIRITPLNTRQYSGDAVKLDSIPVSVTAGKSLIFAVNADSIVVIKDGKIVNKHPAKYGPLSVSLNPSENQLAVGGKDNNVYLYSVTGDKLSDGPVLKGHRGTVGAVSYSHNGAYLASADSNREILVWDTKTNQSKVQGWVFHTAKVNDIAWSPDSVHLASSSVDGAIYIWNIQTPETRIHIKDAARGGVNGVVWTSNNTVVSVGQDSAVKTWSLNF